MTTYTNLFSTDKSSEELAEKLDYDFLKSKNKFNNLVVDSRFSLILDIRLFNADPAEQYYIKYFFKHDVGTRVVLSVNKSDGSEVCIFSLNPKTDFPDVEVLDLVESNSSGITGIVIVDWANSPATLNSASFTTSTGGISANCVIGSTVYENYIKNIIGEADSYPLIKRSKNTDVQKSVKSIFLKNTDKRKYYYISSIEKSKDYTTFYRWLININEADDVNSIGATVARLYVVSATNNYDDNGVKNVPILPLSSEISGNIIIDWDNLNENSIYTAASYVEGGINFMDKNDISSINKTFEIGSNIKETITIDKNGNGDYTTFTAAIAARGSESTFENQLEFLVMPGFYNSEVQGLVPPAYSTIRAKYPTSVIIYQDTLDADVGTHASTVDLYNSCRLIGLIIKNGSNDMYALHTASPVDTVCILEQCYIQHTANNWAIAGDANGNRIIFKGGGYSGKIRSLQHSTPQSGANYSSDLIFEDFAFGNSYSLDSLGCNNNSNFIIKNCMMGAVQGSFNTYNNSLDINDHPADNREWIISGGGNRGLYFILNTSGGQHLKIETANVDEQVSITGSAVEPLFGLNYKNIKGGTRLKGSILSSGDVRDIQVGGYPETTLHDLIQMWKRLGDCSSVNKTLAITVGGTTETYTFNLNYESLETSEVSLLASLNSFFSIVDFSKKSGTENYDKMLLAEKQILPINDSGGILIDEFIVGDGALEVQRAVQGSNRSVIKGIAVESKADGEFIQSWAGIFQYIGSDGEYGVGADSKLSLLESEKIGYIKSNIFYPYY